ncbi:hypothetical protein [Micromonospora fluostatini]|uniref:hypothetical protein n=1 Tax=Micromonospora sp. JCM 30529 TaxID=3421643 RepID=UPI003D1852A1
MSEQYRDDITAAVGRMGSSIGARSELRELESKLTADERVLALVAGRHGPGNGLLTLTDSRVFFLFDGLIRDALVEAPLSDVASVGWESGLNLGRLTIRAGGEIEVSGVDKDGGEAFVAALNEAKAAAPH